MIIVVGGTKGGTGKSTLVTNLAAIAVGQELDCLLVDADRQASASAWVSVREEANSGLIRVSSVQKYGGLALTNELKSLAKKYEYVFVDAGGYDSEELRASMLAADKFYIPLRPAQFDVWTLPRIVKIVQESRLYNPELQAYFIINGAHTHPHVKEAEEVMELASEIEDVLFCRTVIHHRRAFSKAPASGMGVIELSGRERDDKAAEEITSFYEEVMHG